MVYNDQHLHYTGSLPLSYVWEKIRENDGCSLDLVSIDKLFSKEVSKRMVKKDYSDQTYYLFKKDLKKIFSADYECALNYKKFFELYKVVQGITKPKNIQEVKPSYRQGTKALTLHLSELGVNSFDIFAGPLLDQEKTRLRLEGMIQGFEDSRRLPTKGSIRLTFISEQGQYKNLIPKALKDLLDLIISDKKTAKYVSGFDFSGDEDTNNINIISSTINRLSDFKKHYYSVHKRQLKISVHAGENFIDIPPEEYLDFFDKLINLPIDCVGHGVFLWIPNNLVNYSQKINKKRQDLLKKLVQKNIKLEICPTANVLFSPLKSYKDIPFCAFKSMGLKYSINTDNMTLLSTNIRSEYENSTVVDNCQ